MARAGISQGRICLGLYFIHDAISSYIRYPCAPVTVGKPVLSQNEPVPQIASFKLRQGRRIRYTAYPSPEKAKQEGEENSRSQIYSGLSASRFGRCIHNNTYIHICQKKKNLPKGRGQGHLQLTFLSQ